MRKVIAIIELPSQWFWRLNSVYTTNGVRLVAFKGLLKLFFLLQQLIVELCFTAISPINPNNQSTK